jgi:hypothetical protein
MSKIIRWMIIFFLTLTGVSVLAMFVRTESFFAYFCVSFLVLLAVLVMHRIIRNDVKAREMQAIFHHEVAAKAMAN